MESVSREYRCCQECERKSNGEFKKVIDLKASGLSIYVHNDKNSTVPLQGKKGLKKRSSVRQDEIFVLFNPNEKMVKRYDYISEICQFKTKCCQCKALIQRIRSAMGEISEINAGEIKSLCQHCQRTNPAGKCKRCEFIANKFFCNRVKQFEERQIRIEEWLSKVRTLFKAILEKHIFCIHKMHQKALSIDEFDRLLKELDTPLPTQEPDIEEFANSRMDRHNLMKETKDMLENFLTKLRTLNADRLYPSDESLYVSSSGVTTESCACTKYQFNTKMSLQKEISFKRVVSAEEIRSGTSTNKLNLKTSKTVSNKENISPRSDDQTKKKSTRESSSKLLSNTIKSSSKKGVPLEAKRAFGTKGPLGAKVKSVVGSKEKPDIENSSKWEVGFKKMESTEDIPSSRATSQFNSKTSKNISNNDETGTNIDEEKKRKGTKENSSKSLSNTTKSSTAKSKAVKKTTSEPSTEEVSGAKADNENKQKNKSSDDGKKMKEKPDGALKKLILAEQNKKNKREKQDLNTAKKAAIKLPFIDELPIPKVVEIIENEESSESILALVKEKQAVGPTEMISGVKIVPFDPHYKDKKEVSVEPLLFKIDPSYYNQTITEVASDSVPAVDIKTNDRKKSIPETNFSRGILKYELSDRQFIDKGWTKLPTTKVMKRINIYKMVPANLNNNWFSRHSGEEMMLYNTGEKLATVNNSTKGTWYYKNGSIALDYYTAEEVNAGQRVVIYSNMCKEDGDVEKPIPVTVLASFDSLGNGVVYDHYGNIRLKYNQSEGVIIDDKVGPPGRWKWHMLNDPPVLQPAFIDTYSKDRDPRIKELLISHKDYQNGELPEKHVEQDQKMIAIELENFVKEKANKMRQHFKPFQIKMKALKINNHFSLRILDQANIYLLFSDGPITMKLDLGMLLISTEIIDTDTEEVSQIATPYDKSPPRSRSIADIQDILKRARKLGKVKSVASKPIVSNA